MAVHVHDLQKMIRFYKDAFGFELVGEPFEWDGNEFIDRIVDVPNSAARGAMLRCGTCYLEMFEYIRPKGETQARNAYDKGYTHFCVDVTEIEQEYERLKGLGMSFGQPGPIDVGHVKTIYGRDPEGNLIEIQQTIEGKCDFPLSNLTREPTRK